MVEYFVEDKYKNAIKVILEIANSYKDNRPWSPDILISDIRHNSKKFTKLCKEDFEKCNALWKQYE